MKLHQLIDENQQFVNSLLLNYYLKDVYNSQYKSL